MLIPLVIAASIMFSPTALIDYLAKSDPSFRWSPAPDRDGYAVWNLTSQNWHGIPWRHTVVLTRPKNPKTGGAAILIVTGGNINPTDLRLGKTLSETANLPVAILFDVPNQPIDGRREDDLIAHTFQKFLQSGDPSWPLLFPMTKSAIRAMDVLEEGTKASANPLRRFVVTGASKRGWTTWFVGAAKDTRVVGIAPMVIDNLNLPAQMRHQKELWGTYSEMIGDYTERGLQAMLETPEGKTLATIVDPYSYRNDIRCPILIVNGSNDPYWAVDALRFYWNDLPSPKSVVTVPNAGHGLGDKLTAGATLAAFAHATTSKAAWPKMDWTLSDGGARVSISGVRPESCSLWSATSSDNRFVDSVWTRSDGPQPSGKGPFVYEVRAPKTGKGVAWFASFRFKAGDLPYDLTTQVWLQPR